MLSKLRPQPEAPPGKEFPLYTSWKEHSKIALNSKIERGKQFGRQTDGQRSSQKAMRSRKHAKTSADNVEARTVIKMIPYSWGSFRNYVSM